MKATLLNILIVFITLLVWIHNIDVINAPSEANGSLHAQTSSEKKNYYVHLMLVDVWGCNMSASLAKFIHVSYSFWVIQLFIYATTIN